MNRPTLSYEDFTVERYNATCRRIAGWRRWDIVLVLIAGAITTYLFVRISFLGMPHGIQWLTVAWLPGIPIFLLMLFGYALLAREKILLIGDPPPISQRPQKVLMTLVTLGREVEVIERTIHSTLYWTRRCARPDVDMRVWLVVEEPGYLANPDRFRRLEAEGAFLLVVPVSYRTPNGTMYKARAMHYAQTTRAKMQLADPQTWVYHQDEETAVGEDTVRGIQEFVLAAPDSVVGGAGLIAHPLDWRGRASQLRDLVHTFNDFSVLYTVRHRFNLTAWFHGSHLLTRSSAEDAIGWDMGYPSFSEDSLMAYFLRERYGWSTAFDILKGFAYENSAFTLKDMVTQRKRWFRSHFRCIMTRKDVRIGRKALTLFSTVAWLSALPSFVAMFMSFTIGLHSTLPVLGALTGVAWSTLVLAEVRGYDLNRDYLPTTGVSLPRMIWRGLVGALVDAAAPWYGIFAGKTGVHDFIRKSPVDGE